jgi:hypothetical protein
LSSRGKNGFANALSPSIYKVVQIWPGQTVTCLHTNSPGHIWTTLYFPYKVKHRFTRTRVFALRWELTNYKFKSSFERGRSINLKFYSWFS